MSSFGASFKRVTKHAKLAGRVFRAIAFGAIVLAAVLARWTPKASLALAGVFTCALAIRWYAQRGLERLVAAGDRGDVEALRRSRGETIERFAALVAIAIFDGPESVASMDHTFCDCGRPDCPMDGFDADLGAILAALRRVEAGGSWKEAAVAVLEADSDRGEGVVADSVAAMRLSVRVAVMQYMLFRSGVPEPSKTPDDPVHGIGGYGRVLRAPLFFAAASHAKRRKDVRMARELLAKLGPWKPGSRLADKRQALERTLVVEKR